MALFGRRKRTQQCLLLGEERTRGGRYSTSANGPRTDLGATNGRMDARVCEFVDQRVGSPRYATIRNVRK
jgi:hypothetical protein